MGTSEWGPASCSPPRMSPRPRVPRGARACACTHGAWYVPPRSRSCSRAPPAARSPRGMGAAPQGLLGPGLSPLRPWLSETIMRGEHPAGVSPSWRLVGAGRVVNECVRVYIELRIYTDRCIYTHTQLVLVPREGQRCCARAVPPQLPNLCLPRCVHEERAGFYT